MKKIGKISWSTMLFGLIIALLLLMVGREGYLYSGADLQFHFNRMYEFHQNIRMLHFFPDISTYSANEIGSTVISMYPPFPAYVGALLKFVMPWVLVMYTIMWLKFMLQFVIAKYVAKQFGCTNLEAVTVSIVYTISTPLVSQTIQQWLLGEVWGMVFMPLVILGLYRLTTVRPKNVINLQAIVPLTVGMSTVLLSHVLSFAMVLFYTLVYLILLIVFNRQRVQIMINVIVAGLLSMLFTVGFWLPFIRTQLFNKISNPSPTQMNTWAAPDVKGMLSHSLTFSTSTVGLIGILAIVLGIFVWRSESNQFKYLYTISILITLSAMYYPWKYLYFTKLGVIQFPHRILIIPTFIFSLLIVFEIRKLIQNRLARRWVYVGLSIFSILFCVFSLRTFWLSQIKSNAVELNYKPTSSRPVSYTPFANFKVKNDDMDNLLGYWTTYGAYDYLPAQTAVNDSLLNHEVVADNKVANTTFESIPEGIIYHGNISSNDRIVLPFVYYSGKYQITDDKGRSLEYSVNKNQQIVVLGTVRTKTLKIVRQESHLNLVAMLITIFSILTATIFFFLKRKKIRLLELEEDN